jgi:Zn-dependent peptidase ImmA (M78 family)
VKAPYRTDKEIEDLADKTREEAYQSGVAETFPFDAESTIEFHFDYHLDQGIELPIGVLGFTDFENRIVGISNNAYNDGSHRFTVAHELGHIVMHAEHVLSQRQMTPLFDRPIEPHQSKPMEIQADKFAAALLMPRNQMFAQFRPILERDGFINPQDVARTFGVSIQAAEIRLKTLKLLTPQNQDQWFGDA